MKWLNSLREKWRKANEKEKAIDEAVEKQLTPEMKLAILRSRQDSILWWYLKVRLILIFAISMILVLYLALVVATWGAGLKQYYGENVWDNIIASGSAQTGNLQQIVNISSLAIVGVVAIVTVYFIVKFFRDARKEKQLKKEILARLKETK